MKELLVVKLVVTIKDGLVDDIQPFLTPSKAIEHFIKRMREVKPDISDSELIFWREEGYLRGETETVCLTETYLKRKEVINFITENK